MKLHHVQLAIPPGSEDDCRVFYCGTLGWRELEKPPTLEARGGLWLHTGNAEIHLGVERNYFCPARKAHPSFLVKDVQAIANRLQTSDYEVTWDESLPDYNRFYAHDPVGNRLEFMQIA